MFTSDVDNAIDQLADAWETITGSFVEEWAAVLEDIDGAAGLVRDQYVFAHGLGWRALSSVAAQMIAKYGDEWKERFRTSVSSLDWRREADEWRGNAVLGTTRASFASTTRPRPSTKWPQGSSRMRRDSRDFPVRPRTTSQRQH